MTRPDLRACVPAGAYPSFAGNHRTARTLLGAAAGTHRLLAGRLKIVETGCGTIVFKEADEVTASGHYQT
jgi:hypothetical protein